ncbi:MAG: hypothetical protein DMD79_17065 [Candidatus Rokuibacteriota bacterium]|nr:MAG: hypothetical protein DMD79_17065 [Candidatus Rokubacteria bacterium]
MSCVDARDALSALVDEALAPGERAAVEAHVGGCPDCQRELEGLRATVALLRGMERPRAPTGFVDRVVAAARPEPWRRRLGRWLFFPLRVKLPMEAAAVALVAVVAVYVVHRSPELRDVGREAMAPASPPAAPAEAPREGRTRSVDAVRPTSPPSPGRPDRAASQEAPTSQSGPVDKERLYARLKDARAKTEARDGASGVGTATGETSARRADEGSAGDRSAASGNVRRGVGGRPDGRRPARVHGDPAHTGPAHRGRSTPRLGLTSRPGHAGGKRRRARRAGGEDAEECFTARREASGEGRARARRLRAARRLDSRGGRARARPPGRPPRRAPDRAASGPGRARSGPGRARGAARGTRRARDGPGPHRPLGARARPRRTPSPHRTPSCHPGRGVGRRLTGAPAGGAPAMPPMRRPAARGLGARLARAPGTSAVLSGLTGRYMRSGTRQEEDR